MADEPPRLLLEGVLAGFDPGAFDHGIDVHAGGRLDQASLGPSVLLPVAAPLCNVLADGIAQGHLVDVGQQVREPTAKDHRRVDRVTGRPRARTGRDMDPAVRRQRAMRALKRLNRHAQLFEVVYTGGPVGGRPRVLHRRQQQGDENPNHHDHDQQFDQRERCRTGGPHRRSSPGPGGREAAGLPAKQTPRASPSDQRATATLPDCPGQTWPRAAGQRILNALWRTGDSATRAPQPIPNLGQPPGI